MPRKVLQLDGGFNFRDLGGYPSAQQTTVKWHRLMRAAHLANLTAADCQQLEDLGFKLVVDLRSTAEAQQFPDQLGPQMRRIHLPVFDNDETESAASTAQIQRLFARDPLGGIIACCASIVA
ncbi:tyrosine-protein phosphatase [Levilactobacillus brevis]|uniref:tyrosine-protein phosphatase n=1 Tax=Levilactobacillus brevis TaxID=1580 RepID=UPI0021F0650D|nr:tyrosine-protein phosphatase [Levilactobacillus brevis]